MPRKDYLFTTRLKDGVTLSSRTDLRAKHNSFNLCTQCKFTHACSKKTSLEAFGQVAKIITPVFECEKFEPKYRNHQDRDKVLIGDEVQIDIFKPAAEEYITSLSQSPANFGREIARRIRRNRTFIVKSKSGLGNDAMYSLESRQGEYCGTFPSHCLAVAKRKPPKALVNTVHRGFNG